MSQKSKLLCVFCFALTFAFVTQVDAPRLEAQSGTRSIVVPGAPVAPATQSVLGSDAVVSSEYLPMEYEVIPSSFPTQPAASCGCGKKSCLGKRGCKGCALLKKKSCPQCDCDFCELKVSKTKDKKKCFEVEQKEVCIPAVRLPWQKNCPPKRSKVRVINVLKSKTYECPGCKYEWKVYEPEVPKSPSESSSASPSGSSSKPAANSAVDEASKVEEVDPVDPSAPKMNDLKIPEIEKLDLDTVPKPPVIIK